MAVGGQVGTPTELLEHVLPAVSRSFGLSLRVLPASLRAPLGVTYLLARAADTIADTRALPPSERAGEIEALRGALRTPGGPLPSLATRVARDQPEGERALLTRLPELLAAYRALEAGDRVRAQGVLLTLTQAMLDALAYFPAETAGRLGAFATRGELDRYTYMNAGCVGEFWTDTMAARRARWAHLNVPLLRARGARFGQGLQLVNVLRDLPRDLRIGRCYLPQTDLAALDLLPEDLLVPATLPRLRPLLATLIDQALAGLRDGLAYTLAVPRRELRLRLAPLWPLLIGLATLGRIARHEGLLDPAVVVKVPRPEVRRLLAGSVALALSNRALRTWVERLVAAARAA